MDCDDDDEVCVCVREERELLAQRIISGTLDPYALWL